MSRTRAAGRGARLVVVAALAFSSSCGGEPPPSVPAQGWTPGLEQLIPAGADLVARIDWKRAREAEVDAEAAKALRDAGLSAAVLDALEGCLDQAETLRVAIRLGPRGLDGDVMAVITGLPENKSLEDVPCAAQGWKHTGTRRALAVFEPMTRSPERSAVAMMLRSREGAVAVVTPGQVDALLRVLRNGPDADRLDPKGDGVLVLEGRLNDALLPLSWKAKAPTLAEAAQGLLREHVRVQVRGDRLQFRASLTYVDEPMAERAGEKLREVRAALLGTDHETYSAVGKSMHASMQGSVLRLELMIPR